METLKKIKYRGCTIRIHQDTDPMNPMEDWDAMGEVRSFSRRHHNSVKSQEEAERLMEENPLHVKLSYFEHGNCLWMVMGDERPGVEWQWDGTRFAGLWIPNKEAMENIRVRAFAKLFEGIGFVQYRSEKNPDGTVKEGRLNIITAVLADGTPLKGGFKNFEEGYRFLGRKFKVPMNAKALEEPIRRASREYARNCVETYSQWCNGEVYGYTIEMADGSDGDSCWGYYGWDFEKNGLLESAQSSIDYELKKLKEQHFNKLKTQIRNHVPLSHREPLQLHA